MDDTRVDRAGRPIPRPPGPAETRVLETYFHAVAELVRAYRVGADRATLIRLSESAEQAHPAT